jgi:DNA-binding response OmpR family regulator
MTKILIAEDEPDIRDLVAFTLRFAGYEVVTGANGEEAVQVAQKEYPDLILLDVRMPRMTGYEAEIRDGMDAGAEEYLLKPFAPDQLTERVRSILAKFGK